MASLDSCLLDLPLTNNTKNDIVDQFWGANAVPRRIDYTDIDLRAYWDYYIEECSHALHDGGRHISARSHRNILEIVQYLKDSLLRDDIKAALQSNLSVPTPPNEEKLLDSSIDLAARLLLMIDFGNLQYGFSGRRQLDWDKGCLKDFVNTYFSVIPTLGHERVKLDKTFNALNLGHIAGVEIAWTKNLADHLRMTDDDTKVSIFYHASFLKCQSKSSLLPPGLVAETLRTLALLFPQSDPSTRKWMLRLCSSNNLDPNLLHCGHLKTDNRQIEDFTFWHDRLVILKQVFDEARPSTLSQWWYDRRNGVQWYTFWVAILVLVLTLFFGLVQCIEGALQLQRTTATPSHQISLKLLSRSM
ncbi:hypothetical protein K432DRAFT_446028 [Lepidopterella palustris CBS 459.81]|uniref:Uncharacterized protein n=1 Tax=Lepidopterella palustris CBS 459.81 TaxID=1314670 RepID=A0A8E2E303_9PEZI|nr:hypothetical protein K432DRAFT_446028 [Lepidopterella palustris CBS 459.81]